jgi:cell division protein FtsI/penicillin-binding protein 2
MKFIRKNRLFAILFIILSISLVILIFLNINKYQEFIIDRRNEDRENDLQSILDGVREYIQDNNNLPTTSNPSQQSLLPEITFINTEPTGGVIIQSLELFDDYLDLRIDDQSKASYYIGTLENLVIVYTNDFELENGEREVIYKSMKIVQGEDGVINIDNS